MSDQVAVLESIRDVLSGKIPAQAGEGTSAQDAEEILDLTKLVNDDGSITDLDTEATNPEENNVIVPEIITNIEEKNITEKIEEEEMANVSTTAGDDVLDEIDRLLAEDSSDSPEVNNDEINKMLEPAQEQHLEPITDDTMDIELSETAKAVEKPPTESTNVAEEIMHENDDKLISDESADKAKSAISDLIKLTGKEKAPVPNTPSPSFRNGDTVEDLVMESLKPMLKKWLDENLGSLVEEIVQKEIARIIPK